MSEIYIDYDNLNSTIALLERTNTHIVNYIDEIKRKVYNPINDIGNEWNLSTASSLAWSKIDELTSKALRFANYKSTLQTFASNTQNIDLYVESRINALAEQYIEQRTFLQEFIFDPLYSFFMIDLGNNNQFTRLVSDFIKGISSDVGNVLEDARDWFKYGDGKYVLNIAKTVFEVGAAVAGIVVAIATFPVSGPMVAIAMVGLAASTVSLSMSLVNSYYSISSNYKAYNYSKEGKKGAAYYYGNVSKASDYYKKTDMGDKAANDEFEKIGQKIDTTKDVADTVKFITDIASLGAVKDINGKITGYDLSKSNIKNNILSQIGFDGEGYKVGNTLAENFLGKELFENVKTSNAITTGALTILASCQSADNLINVVENTDDIIHVVTDVDASFSDWCNAEISLLDNLETTSQFFSLGKYIVKGKGIIDNLTKDIFSTDYSFSNTYSNNLAGATAGGR